MFRHSAVMEICACPRRVPRRSGAGNLNLIDKGAGRCILGYIQAKPEPMAVIMISGKFPVVANERSRTLGDQVADSIVNAAIHGHIKPGERLIEVDLAEAFGVSRVPIREALKTLESQGIVVALANREVRMLDTSWAMLQQLFSVRLVLERHAADLAMDAIALNKTLLIPFEDALHDLQGAFRKGSPFLAAQADMDFHRALYLATGNQVLLQIWDQMSRKILIAVGLSLYQNQHARVYEAHQQLYETLVSGDREAFKEALAPHVLDAKSTMV